MARSEGVGIGSSHTVDAIGGDEVRLMHRLRTASLLLLSACLPPAFAAEIAKGPQSSTVTCQAGPECTTEVIDGRAYQVLRSAELVVKVSISTEGEYTRADVSIANNSSRQMDVLPTEFRLNVLSPSPRTLEYVEPASLRLPPVAEGRKRRTTVPTIALIPPKPQPDLTASGVLPDGAVEGKVFFERDRRAKLLKLVLPISGATFEFPYRMQ